MNDTMLSLRDHTRPCEHGWFIYHDSLVGDCPGGREIVLRPWSGHESDLEGDDVESVYVEVTDGT